jgi:predicted Zn finger-like uncharacterized protein
MILTCEKCTTRYLVNENSLLPDGKNVKCVKCGYIWFQRSIVTQYQPEKPIGIEPLPNGSALPVIIENNISIWLKILPVFFACMILITSITLFRENIMRAIPSSYALYDALDMPNTQDLKLDSVSVVKNKEFININGFIINNSKDKRKVPAVLITISDENGKKLMSSVMKSPQHYLKTNEKYPIHKRLFNLPAHSYYVTIDIADLFNTF